MDPKSETGIRRRPVASRVAVSETDGDGQAERECTWDDPVVADESDDDPSIEDEMEEKEEEEEEEEVGEDTGGEESDAESVNSESSLIAVSLHKIEQIEAKISEKVGVIGEKMGHIEAKLEEKMGQIGEKVVEIETRIGEKVGELEVKLEQKVEATKANIEKIAHWAWGSMPFDKLPAWMQDNEYLTHAHRPPMYSFRGCFKSMFRMHTETWNIWTHFIGFIFFVALCLGIYVYGDYITFFFEDIQIHQLPLTEQVMLLCFFFGAMICLSCSTMFHLFSNHSQGVYRIFSRLDYSGIALLITGSSIPAYYYGFYCQVVAKYIHMVIVSALCIGCVVLSLWNKFSTPQYRPLRFATFVLFGLYGVVPSVHVVLQEGFSNSDVNSMLLGLGIMAVVYIFGALLYVFRIPERFFPGKFNTWASSHQLFHICVLLAALVHYDTLLSMIKYRLSTDIPCVELPDLQHLVLPVV